MSDREVVTRAMAEQGFRYACPACDLRVTSKGVRSGYRCPWCDTEMVAVLVREIRPDPQSSFPAGGGAARATAPGRRRRRKDLVMALACCVVVGAALAMGMCAGQRPVTALGASGLPAPPPAVEVNSR